MIPKKLTHAIHLCTFLAQAHQRCTTTATLALELGLKVSYVEKIIKPLKESQIVQAIKGPGGGYFIRGDLSHISMADIALAYEHAADEGDEQADDLRVPADYERQLSKIFEDTLREFTLADFVTSETRQARPQLQGAGRFKFKPMAAPFMPKAPNSVFQLSSAY